jgi:hypothetical protein
MKIPPRPHPAQPRYQSVAGCACWWCDFAARCRVAQAKADARAVADLRARGVL